MHFYPQELHSISVSAQPPHLQEFCPGTPLGFCLPSPGLCSSVPFLLRIVLGDLTLLRFLPQMLSQRDLAMNHGRQGTEGRDT